MRSNRLEIKVVRQFDSKNIDPTDESVFLAGKRSVRDFKFCLSVPFSK